MICESESFFKFFVVLPRIEDPVFSRAHSSTALGYINNINLVPLKLYAHAKMRYLKILIIFPLFIDQMHV